MGLVYIIHVTSAGREVGKSILYFQSGLIKISIFVHFLARPFLPYLTAGFAAVSKRNVHWVVLKQIQYVNPGTFCYVHNRLVLLWFYYVASGTYCNDSEFKYSRTVAKNVCSIENPTLNLPDSVDKCKTDIKMHSLMQPCCLNYFICRFELLCRIVVTRDSNRSSSLLKYVPVLCELLNIPTMYENP